MGFSRQEYWSGLACPPPGDLPDPGIEPVCPDLQLDSSPLAPHSRLWSLFVFKFLFSHFLTKCMTLYLAVLIIGTSIPSSVQ